MSFKNTHFTHDPTLVHVLDSIYDTTLYHSPSLCSGKPASSKSMSRERDDTTTTVVSLSCVKSNVRDLMAPVVPKLSTIVDVVPFPGQFPVTDAPDGTFSVTVAYKNI